MSSDIMSISRLRMGTDGYGITTLVGFYGCPLNCKYCINNYCHDIETVRANYTAKELIEALSVDEPYFLMTDGGVTFGGGEPLLQAEFIHKVCNNMNKQWKRTIETSLYVDWKQVEIIIEDIDYWYVDIKEVNSEIYKAYTGKSNKKVLENLKKLTDIVYPEKICVRLPLIPKYNNEEIRNKGMNYILENISSKVKIDKFNYIPINI